MLGLREADETDTCTIATPPGSTLLFCADGLVEVVRDIDEGFRRLAQALRQEDIVRAARPAETLVNAVLGTDKTHDDIAVIIAGFA